MIKRKRRRVSTPTFKAAVSWKSYLKTRGINPATDSKKLRQVQKDIQETLDHIQSRGIGK